MLKSQWRTSQTGTRRGQEIPGKSIHQGQQWSVREEREESDDTVRAQSTDSLIADMAKGFVAAQAQMVCQPSGAGDEMLQLLQKISRQLDHLQQPSASQTAQHSNSPSQPDSSVQQSPQQQSAQSPNQQQSGELQALFSQLLTSGKQGETAEPPQSQTPGSSSQAKGMPAQTAAQALAQAQFELSKELDVSLQKLKQVITESEDLANRIGNLIGKENNSQ